MKILPKQFQLAEHARNVWSATAEYGHTVEDVKSHAYWEHIATKLRPYDRIEVTAEDGSYFVELIVTDVSKVWAKVFVLRYIEIEEQASSVPVSIEQYEVRWRNRTDRFGVIRLSDKIVIESGFATKEAAESHIAQLSKHLAA